MQNRSTDNGDTLKRPVCPNKECVGRAMVRLYYKTTQHGKRVMIPVGWICERCRCLQLD